MPFVSQDFYLYLPGGYFFLLTVNLTAAICLLAPPNEPNQFTVQFFLVCQINFDISEEVVVFGWPATDRV